VQGSGGSFIDSSHFFQFRTNGDTASQAMRIDSDDRLLVGTSSEVSDSAHAKIQAASTGGASLALGRNDSSVVSGNDIGLIRFYGNDDGSYQECARISAQADGDHADNDKPTRLLFSTTADGASSPTERMRILSGGGLTFNGDTATANALDDYEEGTWTPTLYGSTGSAGSEAYMYQSGQYTKIGRLVHARFQIVKSNLGSWTGYIKIGGMPFTAQHSTAGSLAMYPSTNVDAAMRGIAIYSGSTYCHIYGGSKLDIVSPYSELTTSAYLQAAVIYNV